MSVKTASKHEGPVPVSVGPFWVKTRRLSDCCGAYLHRAYDNKRWIWRCSHCEQPHDDPMADLPPGGAV